jgi:hypothetical protein
MPLMTAIFVLPVPVLSDGPPVDGHGNIGTKHFLTLALTDTQKEVIERTHIVSFTAKQKTIMKEWLSREPDSAIALTPSYNDCTCGMGFYVIWNKKDIVSIPIEYNFSEYRYEPSMFNEGVTEELNAEIKEERKLLKEWDRRLILIGTAGKIYFNRKEVKRDQLVSLFKGPKKQLLSLISLPPAEDEAQRVHLTSIANEIAKIAEENGISLSVEGYRPPYSNYR